MTARTRFTRSASWLALLVAVWFPPRLAGAQELETETARPPEAGVVEAGAGYEYQVSSEGSEAAAPMFVELGIAGRLELVVEPVPYTAIRPDAGTHATGAGDLEITLLGLVLAEGERLPAIALAGEIKVPTAGNTLIGTGEYDYTGYLILSKRFGALDASLNLGYAVQGQPPGTMVDDLVSFALAARYLATPRLDLFAEILGNTTTSGEGGSEAGGDTSANPEVAGGELFGTVGAGYLVTPWALVYLGLTYDNTNAFMVHPGLTLKYDVF